METLIFLFILFTILSLVGRSAQKKLPPGPPELQHGQPTVVPPEHLIQVQVGGRVLTFPDPRVFAEGSSSEAATDETAADHDLDLAASDADLNLEAVDADLDLEHTDYDLQPGAQDPLQPLQPVTLEQEVDWEAEHAAFHRKYVDAGPPPATAGQGLLDELRGTHILRRAVLAAEILGPPRALRDWTS